MVYVTGDLHGDIDRLFDRQWRKLKSGDTLIVCGDFGFLWSGDKEEKDVIKYLGSRKYTVAFLDGTHDNYDIINRCRQTVWKGGLVHRISDNLIHLCRGQIYTVEGKRIFTFGGGESTDKDMRIDNNLWWRREEPTPYEMAEGAHKLDEVGCKVDYIITHEPPSLVKSAILLRKGANDRVNKLNGFFEEISRYCDFKHWYFGSLHEDKVITSRYTCTFKEMHKIEPKIKSENIKGSKSAEKKEAVLVE